MTFGIGHVGHFSAGDNVGEITLSTLDSTGVLVLFVTANDATAPVVSSTTLGSWGDPRAQRAEGDGIYEWTKPFSSKLTNEVISFVGFTGGFITMDAIEVRGVPPTSYFNTDASLPSSAGSLPLGVNTKEPDALILAALRLTNTPGMAGAGWTLISGLDYQVVEYKLVTAAQAALAVTLGDAGDSNGIIVDAFIPTPPVVEQTVANIKGRVNVWRRRADALSVAAAGTDIQVLGRMTIHPTSVDARGRRHN